MTAPVWPAPVTATVRFCDGELVRSEGAAGADFGAGGYDRYKGAMGFVPRWGFS